MDFGGWDSHMGSYPKKKKKQFTRVPTSTKQFTRVPISTNHSKATSKNNFPWTKSWYNLL